MSESRLLTPTQTSNYTGIPEATLADWRHRKVGPPYLMISGRRPRYDRVDLNAWIEGQKFKTAPLSEYRRNRGEAVR